MTTASYQKINFSLRPAKGAERKMIVETVGRLRPFSALEAYRYIGFGSPYFSDFSLVHRRLGISEMVCIEQVKQDAERFEFNRPFKCIDLKFGHSSKVLPTLDWEGRPTVIWLDYDKSISDAVLTDIRVVCSSIAPGSFILLTIRAQASDFGQAPSERVKKLKEAVGNRLPPYARTFVTNKAFPRFLWRVIDSEISRVISERSGGFPHDSRFEYQQVLHFDYSDGARMLTMGGVIYQRGQRLLLAQCDFSALSYSRTGDKPCTIRVPLLTFKELRAIDAELPGEKPSIPRVPKKEVDAYSEHYRYFPNFVDAIEP